MSNFVEAVVLILVAHQITTIIAYFSLRREDKGLPPKEHSRFTEWLLNSLLFIPLIGNVFYDCSLGFVDHLRENRLCKMLADRDDEIKRLEKENDQIKNELRIRKKYEDYLLDVSEIDPRIYSYSRFLYLERLKSFDD